MTRRNANESKLPDPGAALQIQSYFNCARCLSEKPQRYSAHDWAWLQVGFTPFGLQVWCARHNINVCHIHFEGRRHPANLMPRSDT
jgi:hypothetical protein